MTCALIKKLRHGMLRQLLITSEIREDSEKNIRQSNVITNDSGCMEFLGTTQFSSVLYNRTSIYSRLITR